MGLDEQLDTLCWGTSLAAMGSLFLALASVAWYALRGRRPSPVGGTAEDPLVAGLEAERYRLARRVCELEAVLADQQDRAEEALAAAALERDRLRGQLREAGERERERKRKRTVLAQDLRQAKREVAALRDDLAVARCTERELRARLARAAQVVGLAKRVILAARAGGYWTPPEPQPTSGGWRVVE